MENRTRIYSFILAFVFLFLLVFTNVECAFGTAPEEEWNQTFGGIYDDRARSVQQTNDGGYIIAGYTRSYGAGENDFLLVKTDSNGNEQWNKTFGGSNRDCAYSVQQTIDGGYIIAGKTGSYGIGHYDFWLIKTDSNGEEQWNKTFGGTGGGYAHSVQQTNDGGYIIAGETKSFNDDNTDFWLIKISAENDGWINEWMSEDSDGGTTITTTEFQDAIHHWLGDIKVRGHLMSTADIQEVITIWLSG